MPKAVRGRRIGEASFRWLLAGSILIPILVFAVVSAHGWRTTLARAEEQVVDRVDILHEHAAKLFETLQLVLWQVDALTAGRSWEEIAASEELYEALARTASALPQVDTIWLARPDGMSVAGSYAFPLPPVNIGDRDYFRAVRDGHPGPFVSKAYSGRLTGRVQFNVASARSMPPGGPFDGLFTVSVAPSYLEAFYDRAITQNGSSIALIRDDGAVLVRHPRLPALGDEPPTLAPGNHMVRAIAAGGDRGIYWSASELEGTEKVYGWRRVTGFPVVVAYAIPKATVLAQWRSELLVNAAISAAAGIALSALVLGAMHRRRLELRLLEDRFHSVQELSLDGTVLLRTIRGPGGEVEDFVWTYANPAALRIVKMRPETVIGQRMLARFPGTRDHSDLFARFVGVVETGQPADLEARYDWDGVSGWFRIMALKLGDGIAVVFTDITERRQTQERLQAALAERDRLLDQKELLIKEVNHRVKNSLQLVTSVLGLDAAATDSPPIRRRLENAIGRVRAIAAVHERLYRSDDVEIVEIKPFLSEICGHLARQAGADSRAVALVADPARLETDRAAPLALLTNELVTNALKHGRTEIGGRAVEVTFHREGDMFRLEVRDHGCGLPPGFDPTRSKGLGMRIARGLAAQLGGSLRFDPAEPGTRAVLTAPLEIERESRDSSAA